MNQSQNPNWFYDQFSKIFTDAASVAQGVRREAEQLFKSQAEKFVNDMDLVKREDFDAVREMAARSREENAALMERVAALEAELAALRSSSTAKPAGSSPPKRRSSPSKGTTGKRRSKSPAGGEGDGG